MDAQLYGANLWEERSCTGRILLDAQLHGANLFRDAQLHEADLFRERSCTEPRSNDLKYPYEPFEAIINKRLGE